MANKSSTMSPKRLLVLLCLAGLLMWFFSNSKVEVEVSMDTEAETEKVEEVTSLEGDLENETQKEKKKNKKPRKNSNKKKEEDKQQNLNDDYLKKRELNYDPSIRNKD